MVRTNRTHARRPHPESPARIPLVRQMLNDPHVRLAKRAIDRRWAYESVIPIATTGFNPLTQSIYYAARSSMAGWLVDPFGPSRRHNFRDQLVREVLMATHDYLHIWAYGVVNEVYPQLGLGSAAIPRARLDDLVFAHLLTEAAATVGLDYWYLASVRLNDVCDIGTRVVGITTPYHDRNLPEYRRFHPTLDVHTKEFFVDMVRLYCTGSFPGFEPKDLEHSPLLHTWLNHELTYGKKQRRYARAWFSYLSHEMRGARSPRGLREPHGPREPHGTELSAEALEAPLSTAGAWKGKLVTAMADRLWQKVKEDEASPVSPFRATWASPTGPEIDFRFVNLNKVGWKKARGVDFEAGEIGRLSFRYLFYQLISQLDYGRCDLELTKLFESLLDSRDAPLVESVLRGQPRLARVGGEPRDLFLPN